MRRTRFSVYIRYPERHIACEPGWRDRRPTGRHAVLWQKASAATSMMKLFERTGGVGPMIEFACGSEAPQAATAKQATSTTALNQNGLGVIRHNGPRRPACPTALLGTGAGLPRRE